MAKKGIKMKTEYVTNRWIRILDMIGMVIAPIIFSLPLFLWAIQAYQTASSTGTNYDGAILFILIALVFLIGFGLWILIPLKHYVYHQETRDEVVVARIFYSGAILGGLMVIYLFFIF